VDFQPARSQYKKVWSALSTTHDQAKLHVIGVTDEDALRATGEETWMMSSLTRLAITHPKARIWTKRLCE